MAILQDSYWKLYDHDATSRPPRESTHHKSQAKDPIAHNGHTCVTDEHVLVTKLNNNEYTVVRSGTPVANKLRSCYLW